MLENCLGSFLWHSEQFLFSASIFRPYQSNQDFRRHLDSYAWLWNTGHVHRATNKCINHRISWAAKHQLPRRWIASGEQIGAVKAFATRCFTSLFQLSKLPSIQLPPVHRPNIGEVYRWAYERQFVIKRGRRYRQHVAASNVRSVWQRLPSNWFSHEAEMKNSFITVPKTLLSQRGYKLSANGRCRMLGANISLLWISPGDMVTFFPVFEKLRVNFFYRQAERSQSNLREVLQQGKYL